MQLKRINFYLSLYQAIGFSLAFLVLSFIWMKEGGMAIFLIFFAALLFIPFIIASISGIFNYLRGSNNIESFIYLALATLVLPSISLPLFYEWGGLIITIFCLAIAGSVLYLKDINKKFIIINVIGSMLLTAIFSIYALNEFK